MTVQFKWSSVFPSCRHDPIGPEDNGITLEHPAIRHLNNLESVFTYEGTHEVHTPATGEAITGLSVFR